MLPLPISSSVASFCSALAAAVRGIGSRAARVDWFGPALGLSLAVAGCGGGGADPVPPVRIDMSSEVASLRYEQCGGVTISLSEPVKPLSIADFTAKGGAISGLVEQSAQRYRLEACSTATAGHVEVSLAPRRVLNVAGTATNTQEAAVRIAIDPRPPIAFEPAFVPTSYVPEESYSYYSPGNGTVNVFYSENQPIRARTGGSPFPSGFLVMVQFQKALLNFDSSGNVRWTFPSGGRFVSGNQDEIFVSDLRDLRLVHILDSNGQVKSTLSFDREVNYVTRSGGKLVVVYNDEGPADVFVLDSELRLRERVFSSVTLSFARAAALSGDRLALADTFGQRVVVQSVTTGLVLFERGAAYPNDVSWRGDFLYVVEEHVDRILAFNLADDSTHIVLGPPLSSRWDTTKQMLDVQQEVCRQDGAYPRDIASDLCSGEFTLYAPNGLYLERDGIWVADTDNSRVIYVAADQSISVLTGLNGPVNVVPTQ